MKRVFVAFLVAASAACGSKGGLSSGEFRGTRLGESPAAVREHFLERASGTWTSGQVAKDFVLDWTATAARTGLVSARFEFHSGVLVAVRADLDPNSPEARGEHVDSFPSHIVVRERRPDSRVNLHVLARDCPTHADEVRRWTRQN